jgi:putative transposase
MPGVPSAIRSDNGSEFVAKAILDWLAKVGVQRLYIKPGSPWQNGYAESFHSRLRDEFLSREEFENVAGARRLTPARKEDYNQHRPHGSLGYMTPVEFAARSADSAPGRAQATPPPAPALQRHCGVTQPELS